MSPIHDHAAIFVILSLTVAMLGSWTALDLFRRVRSHIGHAQRVWLGAAAFAMGLSIWSMHFIAMLGFDPGSPVSYDLPLTVASLTLAIGGTLGAFFSASRDGVTYRHVIMAGVAMGLSICLMHYVGMAAVRTAVSFGYRPGFVLASFGIAVLASTAALFAARRERSILWRLSAAVLLGAAIVGMHYTAMAGLKLAPIDAPVAFPGAPPLVLGVAVAAGSLFLLIFALLASVYDQRLNVLLALEGGRIGYWEFSLRDRRVHLSPRGREIIGLPEGALPSFDSLAARIDPQDQTARDEALRRAIEDRVDYDAEFRFTDAEGEERWINVRGRVVDPPGHRARRMIGVLLDVTDRRRAFDELVIAQARQRVLIDELNHRVKNTLASVQSLVRQTARNATSAADFLDRLDSRLIALSKTHDALTRTSWESASLRDLFEQELQPYRDAEVSLDGPPVGLNAREALPVGLMIHEMTTNAAKYGALSEPGGSLRIDWRLEDGRLHIDWREAGGPCVRPPTAEGFGSRLIRMTIRGELGGAVELLYPPEGLIGRFSLPLSGASG